MDEFEIGDVVLLFQFDEPVIGTIVSLPELATISRWGFNGGLFRVRVEWDHVIGKNLGGARFRRFSGADFTSRNTLDCIYYDCLREAMKKLSPEDLAMMKLRR